MVIKKQNVISWLLDGTFIPTLDKITIVHTENPIHFQYRMNGLKWLSDIREHKPEWGLPEVLMPSFEKVMTKSAKSFNKIDHQLFQPYMDWKQGRGLHISEAQSWAMRDEALAQLDDLYERHAHTCRPYETGNDDSPWQDYAGFGADKYLVSYLEAINEELGNIHSLLVQ